MKVTITEKSKKAFKKAAKKLGISPELPDLSMLREDHSLYMIAVYMLTVIIEAGKDGEVHDITNHAKLKYELFHYAEDGHVAGSSGGGFSFIDFGGAHDYSSVGARLSFNSDVEARKNWNDHPELWEIVILNVK